MPLLADRILETTTTTGTGTFSLAGALTGYRSFNSVFTNGDIVYYTADNGQGEWEVGYGTVGTGTLTRNVIESSNANALVVFSAGAKQLFCTAPAVGIYNASTGGTISGPAVISVNSASDALRITQTGAGNALLVEDSANPDSTPFVVDADGYVVQGKTSRVTMPTGDGGLYGAGIEVLGAAGSTSSFGAALYNNAAAGFGASLSLAKSNSATVGSHALVSNNDQLGAIYFSGSDGTDFIRGAQILSLVDGTPGTNDMPGRLVFSTTADGASIPTERMRIDNAGQVGIGGTPIAGASISLLKNITGATTAYGFLNYPTILSGVTSAASLFQTFPSTQAAAFTLATLRHYYANNAGLGAGSAITNQYGFHAESTLTGATNNFGFYSNIASGTGRWNFYAAGTADNYFAGRVGIGEVPYASTLNSIGGTHPGTGTINYGSYIDMTAPATSTSQFVAYQTAPNTTASAFTLNGLFHFQAGQGTIGSGSTVTNQYGFSAQSTLTGATNNYGFYSNIASGSGRYNFYAAGTAPNYFAGNVYVGGTATNAVIYNAGTIQGSVNSYGFRLVGTGASSVTTNVYGYGSGLSTAAASYTLSALTNYIAFGATVGSGSTITNQYGFYSDSSLTGATNNYGFYSNIASGSGRYNFYAAGTAPNYFAGDTTLAGTTTLNSSLNGLIKTTAGVVSSTTATLSVKNRAGATVSVALTLS